MLDMSFTENGLRTRKLPAGWGGGGPWPLVPRSLAAKEITTTGEWGDVLSGGGGIVADYR